RRSIRRRSCCRSLAWRRRRRSSPSLRPAGITPAGPAPHRLDYAARPGFAGVFLSDGTVCRMRILLARPGETPWHAEGRDQGQEDIDLAPVGEIQARLLGERLREVRIDKAVASPLTRALRTAQLALGEQRAPMLETDEGLMEIAHGTW